MRKFLIIAAAALVVLALITWFALGFLISKAVEKSGTQVLGVETKLGGASSAPFGGKLELSQLEIANPAGFEHPTFLRVGHTAVAVSPMSLLGDTIDVPSFELEDVAVDLERSAHGTNYDAILDSLKRFDSAPEAEKKKAGESKKFMVHDVRIKNVKVHASLETGSLGKVGAFDLTLPEIHLTEVGTGKGGKSVAELIGELVKVVLTAALEQGAGKLPEALLGDLKGSLGKLGGDTFETLRKQLGSGVGGAGKAVQDLGDQLQKIFK